MFEGYLGCTTEYLDVSLKIYTYKRAPQRTYLERGCVHVGTLLCTRVYTTVYTQVYFSLLNSRDMLCEPTPIVAVLLSNRTPPLATSTSPLSSFRSYLYSEPWIVWLSSPSAAPIYRYLLARNPWETQHQPKGSM